MSLCPICYEPLHGISTASPDVCDHIFCLTCLTTWSKHESFCPIDRKRFKKIINLDSETAIQIKPRKRKKPRILYDVTAYCEICSSSKKGNTLLLCDCCDLGYHCECLTPPLASVPSGRWFCPVCVSVERKLKIKKGIDKADDFVTKNSSGSKKSSKTKNLTLKTVSHSLRRRSSSISTPSASDSSCSDFADTQTRPNPGKSRDPGVKDTVKNGQQYAVPNKKKHAHSKQRKTNSNETISSCSQSRELSPILSPQESESYTFKKGLSLLPGCSISPSKKPLNRVFENKNLTPFSVFDNADNAFPSKQKHLNINYGLNKNSYNCQASTSLNQDHELKIVNVTKERKFYEELTTSFASGKIENGNTDPQTACSQIRIHNSDLQSNLLHNLRQPLNCKAKSYAATQQPHLTELKIDDSDLQPNMLVDLKVPPKSKEKGNDSIQQSPVNQLRIKNSDLQSEPLRKLKVPFNCEAKCDSTKPSCLTELSVDESSLLQNHLHSLNHQKSGLTDSNVEDSYLPANPLYNFEARNAQYALNAKRNLQEELKKIEQEKWKNWEPQKLSVLALSSQKPCKNLLDIPKRRNAQVVKISNSNLSDSSQKVFNIAEYTERMRKGTWHPGSTVILERCKGQAYDNHHKKAQVVNKLGPSCSLNVFQVSDSQTDFANKRKCQFFMTSFNSQGSNSSNQNLVCDNLQKNLLQAALGLGLEQFEQLSMRKDGSLYLNWAKSNC